MLAIRGRSPASPLSAGNYPRITLIGANFLCREKVWGLGLKIEWESKAPPEGWRPARKSPAAINSSHIECTTSDGTVCQVWKPPGQGLAPSPKIGDRPDLLLHGINPQHTLRDRLGINYFSLIFCVDYSSWIKYGGLDPCLCAVKRLAIRRDALL